MTNNNELNKIKSQNTKSNKDNGIAKQITAEEMYEISIKPSVNQKKNALTAIQLPNISEVQLPNVPNNGLFMVKKPSTFSKIVDSKGAELDNKTSKTFIKPDKKPPSNRTR